jgi:hypothetical protein
MLKFLDADVSPNHRSFRACRDPLVPSFHSQQVYNLPGDSESLVVLSGGNALTVL